MAQAAHRMAALLATANKEMPETMATLRLSGLEVTDCINQITGLGSDLTGGIRSTAKLATMAEQGVKTGAAVVDQTVTKHVMPVLAKSERTAREVLEAQLRERAKLTYSVAAVREAAQGTSTLVRRVRLGLWAAGAANTAVRAGVAMREVFDASAARQMQAAADVAQQQQAAVRRSSAAARAATTAARAAAQQAASSSVSTAALPNAE